MGECFSKLYHFDELIRWGGYAVLMAIVFAETGLLAGFFLPGDSLLVTAGLIAAGEGPLNIWVLIVLLSLAAIVGDSTGYLIGYHLGPRMFTREDSQFFRKDHLIKTQRFYERYGPKTIVLARFVPIIRTFAPTVAGAGKMRYRTFLTFNVVGGIGWVAGEHIKAYQQNAHCEVVALCSRSRPNAEAARARHGLEGASVYTDYQELLRDPRVDVVSICTMNHEHASQGIAAAEAGKHVLIEKPIALDPDELRRLQRAIDKAGVKSQGGFELHWSPYFQSVHNMLDADFFGQFFYAECDYFSCNWEKWYPGYPWVRTKEKGRAALPAAGCHAIDALRQFVRSDAVEVFAYSGNFTNVMEWDATILTMVRFANGAIGKIGCVLEGNLKYTFNVRLHGAKGTLVNNRFRSTYLDPGLEGWAEFPTTLPDTPEVTHHPFPGEIDDFVDAIRHNKQALLNVHEDAKTYEIVFAAEQSAREGRPIKLPLA